MADKEQPTPSGFGQGGLQHPGQEAPDTAKEPEKKKEKE